MSGRIKLVYTISNEAFDLIRKGKAVLESGGVRDMSGRLLELAVPGKQTDAMGSIKLSIAGKVFSGINMVSSVACNVQCAFIQKGVNEANIKLDELLAGQNQIISGLQVITGLEIANLAVGLVNVGISLAYLPKIKAQLVEVQNSIDELKNHIDELKIHIEKQELYGYRQEYIKYSSSLINFIENLGFTNAITNGIVNVNTLSEVEAYLRDIISKFNNHDIDGTLGGDIIFSLTPLYIYAVKMYSSKFYYGTYRIPNVYNKCLEVIEEINSDIFRDAMKRHLLIDCPEIIMENKYKCFSGMIAVIQKGKEHLEIEKNMWPTLPQSTYENLDQIIMNKIKSDNTVIECDGNRVYIPIEVQDNIQLHLTREMIASGRKINQPTKRLSFDEMLRENLRED